MRTRWSWLVPIVVMAACDGEPMLVPDAGTSGRGGGETFQEPDGSIAMATPYAPSARSDAAVVTPTPVLSVDGGAAPETGMTSAGAPRSCDELAAGGEPDALVDFAWNEQTGACGSSACSNFVFIENGCSLRVVSHDIAKTFSMTAVDCAAARGWATNARFLDVIRNGTGCSGGATPETFEVTLVQDDDLGRKTWGCDEPTLALERTCFGALADRLYPP